MPTETEIQAERERLYESAVLREELNDDDATVLLEWGEKQVIRLAGDAADSADLEQRARFLRQLLKNMNRFVGQRQYNNRDEQMTYLDKVVQWLAKLGFKEYATPDLLDKLPSDAKDMTGTLRALISAIDPGNPSPTAAPPSPSGRLGSLKDAVAAQSAPETPQETPRQRGAGGVSQAHPHERESGDHGPGSQMPTRDSANQAVKSVMEHMKNASKESETPPDTASSMHQAVSDHVKSGLPTAATMPQPPLASKENDALAALKNISKPSDQQPPDDGPHLSKPSSEADSPEHPKSLRDMFSSRMRDKDKDDGKTTE